VGQWSRPDVAAFVGPADAGRSAHLAPGNDDDLIGEAALVQIGNEGVEGAVPVWKLFAQAGEVLLVGVPVAEVGGRVPLRHPAAAQGHDTHAGFDEPAGQQKLLRRRIHAVEIADGSWLFVEVESSAGARRTDHFERPIRERVHAGQFTPRIKIAPHHVKLTEQSGAVLQPCGRRTSCERQVCHIRTAKRKGSVRRAQIRRILTVGEIGLLD